MRQSLWLLLAVSGCSSAVGPSRQPHEQVAPPPAPAPRRTPVTSLQRTEVVRVVEAGLGRFLQKVDVEPSFAAGQFQGFRVVELRPGSFWQGVDLQPGDVVLKVNGLPIERETQAYAAFQSLKSAGELRVDLLRAGQPRSLIYPIVPPAP